MIEKDWLNQPPLYSCCCCVDEYSWSENKLAVHDGKTFCEPCWEEFDYPQITGLKWFELPPFIPKWKKIDERPE